LDRSTNNRAAAATRTHIFIPIFLGDEPQASLIKP
jgi:hypothetical protein